MTKKCMWDDDVHMRTCLVHQVLSLMRLANNWHKLPLGCKLQCTQHPRSPTPPCIAGKYQFPLCCSALHNLVMKLSTVA